jgi:hypothetical protein
MKRFGSAAWNGGPHEGKGSVPTESHALPPPIMRNDKQLGFAKYVSRSICHGYPSNFRKLHKSLLGRILPSRNRRRVLPNGQSTQNIRGSTPC